jgi:hypothetical protein
MNLYRWFRVGLVLGCLWLAGCASPGASTDALRQRPTDPLLATNLVARVFIFVSNDCPICNRYCPEIRRLHEHFAPQGFAFWLVHCYPDETAASIREHDREYGLRLPTLLDPHCRLAGLARAKVVPSVAVFESNSLLVYHGRIDDQFAQLGVERPQALHHDLEDALQAVLTHRPIAVPETQAVGCYLPDSK